MVSEPPPEEPPTEPGTQLVGPEPGPGVVATWRQWFYGLLDPFWRYVSPAPVPEVPPDAGAPSEAEVVAEETPDPVEVPPGVVGLEEEGEFLQVGVPGWGMERVDAHGDEWYLSPWIPVRRDARVAHREWWCPTKTHGRELALVVFQHGTRWGIQVIRPGGSPSPKVEWKDWPGDLSEICIRADLAFAQEGVGRETFLLPVPGPEGVSVGALVPHPSGVLCAAKVTRWLTGSTAVGDEGT